MFLVVENVSSADGIITNAFIYFYFLIKTYCSELGHVTKKRLRNVAVGFTGFCSRIILSISCYLFNVCVLNCCQQCSVFSWCVRDINIVETFY